MSRTKVAERGERLDALQDKTGECPTFSGIAVYAAARGLSGPASVESGLDVEENWRDEGLRSLRSLARTGSLGRVADPIVPSVSQCLHILY